MFRQALALCIVAILAACSSPGPRRGGGTLATFTRTGGIAGFNDSLVVGSDGSLVLTDKNGAVRRGEADPKKLTALDGLLHGAEFRALLPSYSTGGGADRMTYTVAVPEVGKVTTMDGSNQPEVLSTIIEQFAALIGSVK